jgi:hypothetical protein
MDNAPTPDSRPFAVMNCMRLEVILTMRSDE